MPLSTDVRVPRDLEVRFPSRCVGCGEDPAGGTWRVTGRTASWLSLVTPWIGRRFAIDVPCCDRCRPGLARARRRRAWGSALATLGVTLAALVLLDPEPGPWRRPLVVAVVVVALVPTLVYEALHPHAFDLHVRRRDVDLEFRDPQLAAEVAELNADGGAELVD